ncbi:UDP-glycosyltransferase 74E2-like [Andrographis paniculata]|uniref:UDP-glycosyltransferase 74E2-like n=1 Tax=Andrographis paniculata TaxID=175694 RepID=UPI001E7CC4E3|nr:UDP-glycosyltransferase 74E2-like [Andrographis paniculata]QZJ84694.1 UDP-glycosyltransferase 23 [Andrographis paniculata]
MAAAAAGANEEEPYRAHCIFIPYPLIGHINPMLQFAKRLRHKSVRVTFLLSKFVAKIAPLSSDAGISAATYSDGFDDGPPPGVSVNELIHRFLETVPPNLKESVQTVVGSSGPPVACVVYDSILTAALDVAADLGIAAAAFFTQSCAVDQIFHEVYLGNVGVPFSGDEEEILIPGLPALTPADLPSFVCGSGYGQYPPIFEMLVDQFQAVGKAQWLFFNTFYQLENKVIDYMEKLSLPVKAIGPAIPSMHLDKRLSGDRDYGLNMYAPATATCLDWLSRRDPNSVVYVSFGSLAQLGPDQMEELAWGLKLSGRHFLWVVRLAEQSKLPEGFTQSENGLVVPWGPQLDILGHVATACFITHCGWNSTLEALSLGVPVVAMPQWTDQPTNAKYIKDMWGTGVRVVAGENGVVGRNTVAECVKEATESEEMKRNATKWKELAREAMDEGGSSDTSIEEFVAALAAEGSI